MTVAEFVPLVVICFLGAMSPGPSLAIVVRHSVTSGTRAGVICALSHGVGIFLWAALMVSGLGARFLLYLGCRALMTQPGASTNVREASSSGGKAAREGLVIALSNPKVAVFFAALFSQFIQPDATLRAQFMIATTAAVIDALWYTVVALLLSRPAWSGRFMQHGGLLGRGLGAILIALSVALLWSIWRSL